MWHWLKREKHKSIPFTLCHKKVDMEWFSYGAQSCIWMSFIIGNSLYFVFVNIFYKRISELITRLFLISHRGIRGSFSFPRWLWGIRFMRIIVVIVTSIRMLSIHHSWIVIYISISQPFVFIRSEILLSWRSSETIVETRQTSKCSSRRKWQFNDKLIQCWTFDNPLQIVRVCEFNWIEVIKFSVRDISR
jgi:hypothetical protein